MFNILGHGAMIADRVRMDAYARAIAATVTPGDVVLDLGTGTGVFAILAARAGARHVFAVESGDIIEAARELARANSCDGVIEFIQADSRTIELPERANVLVADIRGVVPFFSTSLLTWIDVRKRLSTLHARLIPQRDVLRAALVESPAAYAPHDGFGELPGVDLGSLRRLAVNHTRKAEIHADDLISPATDVAAIDYATIETPDFGTVFDLHPSRDGLAHGMALWFDTTLADGIGFSNAPGQPELIYGQLFIPFERPLDLKRGSEVAIDLRARLLNEDDYLWRWTTSVDGEQRFDQCTFFAYPHRL